MREPWSTSAKGGSLNFVQVYLGENYWRVSKDKSNWSVAQKFKVEPGFLPNAPKIVPKPETLYLLGDSVTSALYLQSDFNESGFVIEASKNKYFHDHETRTFCPTKEFFASLFTAPEFTTTAFKPPIKPMS